MKNTNLNRSVCGLTWGYFLIPFINNNLELTFYYWPKSRYLLDDAWIHVIADRKKGKSKLWSKLSIYLLQTSKQDKKAARNKVG